MHTFLISTLEKCEWSALCPSIIFPGAKSHRCRPQWRKWAVLRDILITAVKVPALCCW